MRGCIHIYCGDGKGKTSAAIGLAVRAAGRGKHVLIARFLKTDDSGEVPILCEISGITVIPCRKTFGFVFRMSEEEKVEATAYYHQLFSDVCQRAIQEAYDVLVLDEIMASCGYGMVAESQVLDFLRKKPLEMEVMMTGRDPSPSMVEIADYVSEIKMVKHPYEKGIPSRLGIEF